MAVGLGVSPKGLNMKATGATYSFMQVTCTFIGPGAEFVLSHQSSVAEEGITIKPVGEQNKMTIGAGGGWMHSMIGAQPATVVIRLLQISNANAILQDTFDLQKTDSEIWGKNVIEITEHASGTHVLCQGCAFKNWAEFPFHTDGGIIEWEFDCGRVLANRGTFQQLAEGN